MLPILHVFSLDEDSLEQTALHSTMISREKLSQALVHFHRLAIILVLAASPGGTLTLPNLSLSNITDPERTANDSVSAYDPSFTLSSNRGTTSPVCDLEHFGYLPDSGACREAVSSLRSLGRATTSFVWADRGYGAPHIQIPYRATSCESCDFPTLRLPQESKRLHIS